MNLFALVVLVYLVNLCVWILLTVLVTQHLSLAMQDASLSLPLRPPQCYSAS